MRHCEGLVVVEANDSDNSDVLRGDVWRIVLRSDERMSDDSLRHLASLLRGYRHDGIEVLLPVLPCDAEGRIPASALVDVHWEKRVEREHTMAHAGTSCHAIRLYVPVFRQVISREASPDWPHGVPVIDAETPIRWMAKSKSFWFRGGWGYLMGLIGRDAREGSKVLDLTDSHGLFAWRLAAQFVCNCSSEASDNECDVAVVLPQTEDELLRGLSMAARALQPDGRLIVAAPNAAQLQGIRQMVCPESWITESLDNCGDCAEDDSGEWQGLSQWQLRDKLIARGFHCVSTGFAARRAQARDVRLAAALQAGDVVLGHGDASRVLELTASHIAVSATLQARALPELEPEHKRRSSTAVIVVASGCPEATSECVESLLRTLPSGVELILVDNGCDEKTKEILVAPDRGQLMVNYTNMGLPAALNKAIDTYKFDYYVVVSNDTAFAPGWLEGLLRVADSDRERAADAGLSSAGEVGACINADCSVSMGVVGPMLTRGIAHQVPKWSTITLYPQPSASSISLLASRHRAVFYGKTREVPYVSRACMLISRLVIDDIGGFDEDFFPLGFEDIDFCLRARIRGHRVAIAEDVLAYHRHSGTAERRQPALSTEAQRGWNIFRAKWKLPLNAQPDIGTYRGILDNSAVWSREDLFVPLR